MHASSIQEIRDRIDNGPVAPMMLVVIAIGFLLNMVDGFDVVAMSVAGPSITTDWGISDAEKGWILSAALIGMAVGAAVLAPYSDVYGRRIMILAATALIGVSMVATGFIPQSVSALIALRAVSGLGIGVIFASGATIAAEFAPERFRNLAVTTVVMGYPFGAMLVGPVAQWVIPAQGWEMLFVYGGVATLLLGVGFYFILPESVEYLASKRAKSPDDLGKINSVLKQLHRSPLTALVPEDHSEARAGRVTSLFEDSHAANTIILWSVYFLGFLTLYFLLSWIPSLFVDAGFSRREGIAALTQFNFGGVLGILAIGLLTTRLKLSKPISVFFVASAVCLVILYAMRIESLVVLNASILIIGFSLQGAFTAMYALAARIYPTTIRATGIGWAAGLGRTGAIVSPIVAGYLSGAGWDLYSLSLLFAVPLFIAGALVLRYRV
ncbi:MAG: MFS transporter [Pseudomonadota bacterium]